MLLGVKVCETAIINTKYRFVDTRDAINHPSWMMNQITDSIDPTDRELEIGDRVCVYRAAI